MFIHLDHLLLDTSLLIRKNKRVTNLYLSYSGWTLTKLFNEKFHAVISKWFQMLNGIGCSDRHNVIHEIKKILQHVSEVFSIHSISKLVDVQNHQSLVTIVKSIFECFTYHQHRETECQNTKIYKYCSKAYHCNLIPCHRKYNQSKYRKGAVVFCVYATVLQTTFLLWNVDVIQYWLHCPCSFYGMLYNSYATIVSGILRKYKWLVEYSVAYHLEVLHNYYV